MFLVIDQKREPIACSITRIYAVLQRHGWRFCHVVGELGGYSNMIEIGGSDCPAGAAHYSGVEAPSFTRCVFFIGVPEHVPTR